MASWDSAQYLLFKNERTQPSIDLANRIPLIAPRRMIDIGCGPGNSTEVLARRFPQASVLGVDNSEAMIATARKDYPQFAFQVVDASIDLPSLGKDFDVVFSNACIQWVPNHPKLIQELMDLLAPGGVLAVQTPMNYEEPIHKIIDETVHSPRWQAYFSNPRIFFNLTPAEYFDVLAGLTSEFTLWNTTYFHRMSSHQAILQWYKGTGLRPYLDSLPSEEKPVFEEAIYQKIVAAYPAQQNGEVIFRFPRFFFMAVKPAA